MAKPTHTKNEFFGRLEGMTEADYKALQRAGTIEHEGQTYLITDLAYSVRGNLLDVVWFGILCELEPWPVFV